MKIVDWFCMEPFRNLNTKSTEVPQSSVLTHPFSDVPLFKKYLNPQAATNRMVKSVVYHPCLFRLA